jgi:hypothetical protein
VLLRRVPRAFATAVILWLLVIVLSSGDSPYAPERNGFPNIIITCEPVSISLPTCQAIVATVDDAGIDTARRLHRTLRRAGAFPRPGVTHGSGGQ